MAKIKLNGDTSGYIEISAPAVSGNNTLELGPGTRILTNLDNTFTGVSTFSSNVYLGNDIYLTDGSSGYEKVEVGANDIRVESKHVHSEFGVWTRSSSLSDRRNGIDGDNNDLRFYSNYTEKVRISSDGKVGINTVSPRAVLDIEGNAENATLMLHSNDANANLQFSDNTGGARILNYGGDLAFRTGTNAHSFGTGDSEAIRITSDNKLGINITNPTRQLEIYNSSHATAALQSDTQSSLFFSDPSDTNIGQISYMHSGNYMYFRVNDAERLRVTSDGKMGVGTQSPDVLLHLSETNADPYNTVITHLKLNNSGGNGGSGSRIELKTGAARCWIQSFIDGANSNSGGALVFGTPSSGTLGTERLRIASDGRITHTGKNGAAASTAIDPLSSFVLDDAEARLQLCATNGGNNAAGVILSNESKHWIMHQRGPNSANRFDIGYYDSTSPSDINQQASPYVRISKEGAINLPQQPRFFAYASTTLTKSTGWHTYSWEHTRFNVGNNFSTSTNLFTVPVNGCYLFGAQVRFDNAGSGYFRLIISINGSTDDNNQAHSITDSNGSTGDLYHSQAVTGLYELSANDNIRVQVYSNTDTSWQPHSESQFWGYLVA